MSFISISRFQGGDLYRIFYGRGSGPCLFLNAESCRGVMKAINIYALTRVADSRTQEKLERQLSGRKRALKIKEWETEGLKALCARLKEVMEDACILDFFYSFTMPKLGKEFDLLRVDAESVVNIELKSGNVTDEAIQAQLLQNRYYLATLGRSMYFFTYVSREDRLMRLASSGRLMKAEWTELAAALSKPKDCCREGIEDLFKEDRFLISPITDPGRFLRREYFLTFQQKDIRRQILKALPESKYQCFTGLPGTGKTLLLYDIALQLSGTDNVVIFHFGSHEKELEELDARLKRVDFCYYENRDGMPAGKTYSAVLVDEGHRMNREALEDILSFAEGFHAPVIFSYDMEDPVSPDERGESGAVLIEALPGIVKHRLTNRIRLNGELSSFIRSLMCIYTKPHRPDYPSVSAVYADDGEALRELLRYYEEEGYIYIKDGSLDLPALPEEDSIEASAAACKEFERVVMVMDESFYYDGDGYLRSVYPAAHGGRVRNLFQGMNRAKERLALVIYKNEELFGKVTDIF